MSAVDFVKFQKPKSESESSDSTCTSVKIPENVEDSVKISTRNFQNTETDDRREFQLLKLGRQSRCRNRAWWCFVFVFLWALMTTVFCLGFFMGNNGKDAEFQGILKEVQLTLSDFRNGTGHQLTSDLKSPPTSGFHDPLVANSDQKVNISLHNPSPDLNPEANHNVNSTEFAEVKGQLDDIVQKHLNLDQRIKDQGTQINNKIISDHRKLEVKLRGQHGEIKDKLETDVDDLKSQLNDVGSKKTKEINSARDEVKKETSKIKDQMKAGFDQLQVQIQQINVRSSAPAPASVVTSTPPTFSTPRFFADEQSKGAWFSPAPGWEKKCIEMPPHLNVKASSVKVGGHCLLVCKTTNCESSWRDKCIEIHPDSYGLDNLQKIDYNDKISSFRQCKTQ